MTRKEFAKFVRSEMYEFAGYYREYEKTSSDKRKNAAMKAYNFILDRMDSMIKSVKFED